MNDGCSTRLCQLAFPNSLSDKESTIDFEKFCDCFVAALSDVSDETTHEISDEHSEDVPPCEGSEIFKQCNHDSFAEA